MDNASILINFDINLPVINGFVSVPNLAAGLRVSLSDALAAISGSYIIRLDDRTLYWLPQFEKSNGYPTSDYYATLRSHGVSYLS